MNASRFKKVGVAIFKRTDRAGDYLEWYLTTFPPGSPGMWKWKILSHDCTCCPPDYSFSTCCFTAEEKESIQQGFDEEKSRAKGATK